METCLSCLSLILRTYGSVYDSLDDHQLIITGPEFPPRPPPPAANANQASKAGSSWEIWEKSFQVILWDWVFGPIPRAFSRQRCEDLANFTMESMEPWKKKQPREEDGWSFPNDDVCTCLKVLELIIVDVDVLSVPAPFHFLQYHDLSKLEDSAF